MFRALPCSSLGGKNYIITVSGIVALCKRPLYSTSVESRLSPLTTDVLYSRLHSVTIPDAVIIEFLPPKDEHGNARNMSRIIM